MYSNILCEPTQFVIVEAFSSSGHLRTTLYELQCMPPADYYHQNSIKAIYTTYILYFEVNEFERLKCNIMYHNVQLELKR